MRRTERPALQRANGKRFTGIDHEPSTPSTGSTSSTPIVANTNKDAFDVVAVVEPPPNDDPIPIHGISSRRTFVRNRARAEQTREKLQEMQLHLERATVDATNGPHTQQLKESEEIIKLVSNLTETNRRNEDVIKRLERQMSELKSENEFVNKKARHWKKTHSKTERLNYELVEKMAPKALEQLQSHGTADEAKSSEWKSKYEQMGTLYDNLVEKIGDLARDNEALLARCQRLEEKEINYKEDLAAMDEVQDENDALQKSMEDAVALTSGMSEKMATFAREYEASVAGYEERLASLKDELDRTASSNAELSAEVDALKEENKVLKTTFEEAEDYFDRDTFIESNAEKELKKENKRLRAALEEAREAQNRYEVELNAEKELKEENNGLRAALEEAKEAENHYKEELIGMSDKMATFTREHEASATGYEERLVSLKDELDRTASSNAELSAEVGALKEENEVLRMSFEEAEDYFDRDTFIESNAEKEMKKENKRLRAALEEARVVQNRYEVERCAEKELKEENNGLRAALEEAKEAENHYKEELIGMSEKMATFARKQEESVAGYEERLVSLKDELDLTASSNAEFSAKVDTLKEENEVLRTSFEEAEDYFDRDTFIESNAEKEIKKENKRLRAALKEAREAQNRSEAELNREKELKEKNNGLRAALEEAKEAENQFKEEFMGLDAKKEAFYRTCECLQRDIEKLGGALEESK